MARLPWLVLLLWFVGAPSARAFDVKVAPARAVLGVDPGGNATFPIEVQNGGKHPMYVRAFVWDLAAGKDWSAHPEPPGTQPNSAAAWITVLPRTTTVPAGGSAKLLGSVSVPKQAKGARYATLFVQIAGSPNAKVAGRVAVLVLIRVRGTGVEALAMNGVKVTPATTSSPAHIVLDVKNTGSVHVEPQFVGVVRSTDGEILGRVSAPPSHYLLPGQSGTLEVTWAGTPGPGAYQLVGTVSYGKDHTLPVVTPLVVEGSAPPAPKP